MGGQECPPSNIFLAFDLGIGFAVICDYTGKEVVG